MKDAQKEQDHPLTTDNVSISVVIQIRSSELTCNAHHVNGAHQEQSQIPLEDSASKTQDHQLLLESHNVVRDQSITVIELNVSHAHQVLLPPLTEPDANLTAMVLLISSKPMVAASLAVTETYQTQPEPDA